MTHLPENEWQARLTQADKFEEVGTACSMCGGTGGWPGISGFTHCRPCNGTGSTVPLSGATN
jgi:RecJ-like exonuclease